MIVVFYIVNGFSEDFLCAWQSLRCNLNLNINKVDNVCE